MSDYLAQFRRNEVNSSYPKWKYVSSGAWSDLYDLSGIPNQDNFLNFKITNSQHNQLLEGLKDNKDYVDAEGLNTQTSLNGWSLEDKNNGVWDLTEVPNAYVFLIETPRGTE
jgi:hypothetical protein